MHYLLRAWETMTRPERITAMALAVGGTVAIVNSTAWALTVSYMAHQRTRVELARLHAGSGAQTTAQTTGDTGTPGGHAALPVAEDWRGAPAR